MQNENKENPENNNDAQKYFDENEYRTAFVGKEEDETASETKGDKLATLIALLTAPENKDFKEEALITLKKEKAGDLLLAAIKSPKGKKHKAVLMAACWESEINYSEHLPFFVEHAMDKDYLVSLEAITVIENMEGPFKENELNEGITTLKAYKSTLTNEQQVLINDLIIQLQSKLNA